MAVIKLVLAVCVLASPALSRPALGPYNAYNYNSNNGFAPGDSFDPHPRYSYDYRVAEPRTGDYKSAQESRDGDAVRGSYSVAEPDGSLLTVRYAADDANGYTAVVERSGHGGTVVNTFPGPAPSPVAPAYNAGYNGAYNAGYNGAYNAGYNGAYNAGYNGAYNAGYNGAYNAGYNGAYNGAFGAPKPYVAPVVRPIAPSVAPLAPGAFVGGYGGSGATSTSFSGPHASYHY